MKFKSLVNSVEHFFFAKQPVHTAGLLRIFFGVVMLINWFMVYSHLDIFWGTNGLLSLETSVSYGHPLRFNLFELLPNDPRVASLIAGLHLIGAIGMIFGLFTRTSIAIVFFTLLSFHNRNVFILNSADIVIRNFLFLMFFAPCGDIFSIDRWIQKRRGIFAGPPEEKSGWALRLLQIQFSIIYISTVMFKMKGEYWADGTAVYVATRLDEFVRVPLELLNNLAVIKFLTWSTLVVELALGTLVWFREWRYWVLIAGVGLHLGIELVMNIPMFEWIMIVAMICMIDPHDMKTAFDLLVQRKLSWKFFVPSLPWKIAKAEH